MKEDFSNLIELLKAKDYDSFEKLFETYIVEKEKYSLEERGNNYILLKNYLEQQLVENDKDKPNYTKIFRYTIKYLNVEDYDNLNFWKITAQNFKKFEMYKVALKCYFKYLKLENADKRIYKEIADIYYKTKEDIKSLKYYEKYTNYFQDDDGAYNMVGHLYEKIYKSGYLQKQIENFEKAHKIAPKNRSYIKNLELVAAKNKDMGRFCKYSDMVIKKQPNHQELFDFACWSLYNKMFKNFHKYYRHRFYKKEGATQYPNVDDRLWNGIDDISDKKLIVRYEQGFGDSIAFVRFLPMLKKIVPNFTFVVQKQLLSLFKYNYPDIDMIDNTKDLKDLSFDYQIPLMNMFSVFKITDKTMPDKNGYLKVREDLSETLSKKIFNNDKFKIGIAFRGCADYKGDNRDMPEEIWVKLTSLPDVQVYSFQIDNKDKMFSLPESEKIIDLSSYLFDFEQTAAALKSIDLIITTDNVLLNLSGAMGLKTFGLFNFYPDFRWFILKGNDTGWYNSIKAYKTKQYNAWNDLFDNVLIDVQKLINNRTKNPA